MKHYRHIHLAIAAFSMAIGSADAAITLLSEDWQTVGMGTGDISVSPNAALTGWTGFSGNYTNPTMLSSPATGNVLRDQGGFGGTYGSATNAGNAVRVRSTNAAMLNEAPLLLTSLELSSVTFSFDLKKTTTNYYHLVEFSNNIGFLNTGTTSGVNNAVVLLDTLFVPTPGTGEPAYVPVWEAKSYTLTAGAGGLTFTDASYFRIRKQYLGSQGQGGANGTFHIYDNLLITGVEAIPEPSAALLGGLGLLALLRRRR